MLTASTSQIGAPRLQSMAMPAVRRSSPTATSRRPLAPLQSSGATSTPPAIVSASDTMSKSTSSSSACADIHAAMRAASVGASDSDSVSSAACAAGSFCGSKGAAAPPNEAADGAAGEAGFRVGLSAMSR
jgi:hypothetical protein